MDMIKGGFALNTSDELVLNKQRAITAVINNSFIQVGAVFLQPSGKNPYQSDWAKQKFRDTDIQRWIDSPDYRVLNLGFNLQLGWLDVDIDSPDERYHQSIIRGFRHVGVDTRFAFGRMSKKVPSHLMVQLNEADFNNYDINKEFEPKEFKMGDKRFKTELRSMGPIPDTPNAVKQARQTVMPGSVYIHKNQPNAYDISVWYDEKGQIAKEVNDVATTTPRKTTFLALITGIAYGTFLYAIQPHWVEGNRQNIALKISGWLARVVRESVNINESEGLSRGTFCPIGTPEIAESMIEFLCAELGDSEAHMRKRVFRDALRKLENNPDAKVPGWPALESEIGIEAITALRTVFMPGRDVSPLASMSEVYLYDRSRNKYVDRIRFDGRLNFVHDGHELETRHKNEFIEIAGKKKPIWREFEMSQYRTSVDGVEMYPQFNPGCLIRITVEGEILSDDEDSKKGTMTMFNTWRGWPVKPAENPDPELIDKCTKMLNKLLQYLTQDNPYQVEWTKKWLAWTVQFPADKQQVAPVFVGGQGVGKSFFGNIFLSELFGPLWGSASPRILESAFSVEPFIGKMFVFIDEAKFHSEASTDEIKKIIRNVDIGGAEKFQSAQNHRIFTRVAFASNRFDMNIGQRDTQDRALFYIKCYDKDFLHVSEGEFKIWAVTLKPFFNEFNAMLKRLDVKQHFMYILSKLPVAREEIEDTRYSSSNDVHIIVSNMSPHRRAARHLIEDGRVWEDLDISAPFTMVELYKRIGDIKNVYDIRFAHNPAVINELRDLIEPIKSNRENMYRFKYKIGTLTDMFGASINMKLEPRFPFTEDDYGDNDCTELQKAKPWRGSNTRFRNGI